MGEPFRPAEVQVRERYELAANSTEHVASPGIAELLARLPRRIEAPTAGAYLTELGRLVTWSDCYALERETIAALPDAMLATTLRQQRNRYSQIAAGDEYTSYLKSALDLDSVSTPTSIPIERVRAELAAITERIGYLLTASAPRENIRGWLTLYTVILMLLGMAAIFVSYTRLYVPPHTGTRTDTELFVPTESLFVVLFAGLVGGFVSVQQRLQQPTLVDPLYKRVELEASGFSLLVSPLIGMIFAVVLFVIMLGNLVDAGIFPQFACPVKDPRCSGLNLASFAAFATPKDGISWAKLVFWAFAAGFLERLVPDILTRLGSVATNAK